MEYRVGLTNIESREIELTQCAYVVTFCQWNIVQTIQIRFVAFAFGIWISSIVMETFYHIVHAILCQLLTIGFIIEWTTIEGTIVIGNCLLTDWQISIKGSLYKINDFLMF